MKIALISYGLYPFRIGGIQKHSYCLIKYLTHFQIAIDVYLPHEIDEYILKQHFTSDELKHIIFKHIHFPKSIHFPGHYIYDIFCFSKKTCDAIKKDKYDCIYAQGLTGYSFLNTKLKDRLITNLHGLEMYQSPINFKNKYEHFLLRILANPIIKKSERQISLGGKLTDILYTYGAKNNSVFEIPNAIEANWSSYKGTVGNKFTNTKRKFIFIGRYERRKGIEELNIVLQKLIHEKYQFEITIIGALPDNKKIYHPNITYLGIIKDSEIIKKELYHSDVLLCPSYSEGMPTVILEAMICKCAVIATNVGANDTLVDKQNGWLINVSNITNNLKIAIKEAINTSNENLIHMGENSKNKVKEKYTWEIVAKQTLNLLKLTSTSIK